MAKKVYWESVKKWAISTGISAGIAGFALLFIYISMIGAIEITGYSDDTICAGTIEDPCIAYVNFTAKEDIFLYPMDYDPYGRDTPFYTDVGLKEWHMYRSWGTGWREIDLTTNCKGTWCGAPSSTANTKYSFAFRKDRDYQIKIVAYKEDSEITIKWGFADIDPFWYGVYNRAKILDNKKYRRTYRVLSITGNEKLFYDVIINGNQICLIQKTDHVVVEEEGKCLKYDLDRCIEFEKKEVTYYAPDILKLTKNKNSLSAANLNKDLNKFCYTANPLIDYYLKFGEHSIIVVQDISSTASLINTAFDINFTHINISNTAPFDQLVLYTPFDRNFTLDGNVYDYSKYDDDPVNATNIYYQTNGVYGGMANFTGGDTYIAYGEQGTLDLNNEMAISFWLNFYGQGGGSVWTGILGNPSSTSWNNGFGAYVKTDEELIKFFVNNYNTVATVGITNDGWHHIVGVYNGSNVLIYKDGVKSVGLGYSGAVTSGADLYIGRLNTDTYDFSGLLDDFMIFNTSLTDAQVLSLYRNQSSRYFSHGYQEYKYLNLSGNRVNVSVSSLENLMGSKINLSVGYDNGSWYYTSPQTVIPGTTLIFNTSGTYTNLTLNFTLIAGNRSNYFYSPTLNGTTTITNWSISSGSNASYYNYNITLEMESQHNFTLNLSGVSTVCVDVDHPSYGDNYSCGSPNVNLSFNITYFRKKEFNDSTTVKNISWINGGNHTLFINGHRYDEIINLTINISSYSTNGTYPHNFKIYVNNSLSNNIGNLFGNYVLLSEFSNGNSSEKIRLRGSSEVRYLKIPKAATIINASFNITGYVSSNGSCYQESANVSTSCGGLNTGEYGTVSTGVTKERLLINYSIPQNNTFSAKWTVKHSNYSSYNVTIPSSCFNYNKTKLRLGFQSGFFLFGLNAGSGGECYDGVWNLITSASQDFCYDGVGWNGGAVTNCSNVENKLYDGNWNTQAWYYYGCSNWINNGNCTAVYEEAIIWDIKPPLNPNIVVGFSDGTHEWNYTGLMNFTLNNKTDDFASSINTYLVNCTQDEDGYCLVPIYFSSDNQYGDMFIDGIEINYSFNINPVALDIDLVKDFFGNSTDFSDLPLKFESSENGTIQINDINFDYSGGNDTIEMLIWEEGNKINNQSNRIKIYVSSFFKNLPYTWTDYIFFLPRNNNSKNVSAYGQKTSIPIFNITTTNYGGKNLNLSIRLNQTYSCLNLTWNTNNSKPSGNKLNTSFKDLAEDLEYLNNTRLWIWADLFNCNISEIKILKPQIQIDSYCTECLWN